MEAQDIVRRISSEVAHKKAISTTKHNLLTNF